MIVLFLLIACSPLRAQALSPIQEAVLRDDGQALTKLAIEGHNWLFWEKPSRTNEGTLLLDFALANNKEASFTALRSLGAQPGVSTVFAALRSQNHDLAIRLAEGGLSAYEAAAPLTPLLTLSNQIFTNVSMVFTSRIFTNISQVAVTNALGQLNLQEFTNLTVLPSTNLQANIGTNILSNYIQRPQIPSRELSLRTVERTNIQRVTRTNYTENILSYAFTNHAGKTEQRIISNLVPQIVQGLHTNITQETLTNISLPRGFTSRPASLTRGHFLELASIAESQDNPSAASYFLRRAQTISP